MMTTSHADALIDALTALAERLEAGDLLAAADAARRLEEARRACETGGVVLDAERGTRARALETRCQALAAEAVKQLNGTMSHAGRSRRAHEAYET